MRLLNDSGFVPGWLVGHLPVHGLGATLIVKATFTLVPGAKAQVHEEQEGLDGDQPEAEGSSAIRHASDFAPWKPKADLLLAGSAHGPGGGAREALRVSFGVGSWEKSLLVLGDRVCGPGGAFSVGGSPLPFRKMPLDHAHAYGGRSFERNPAGRGHDEVELEDGATGYLLPNVVREDELTKGAGSGLEPAGFGPIAPGWPERMAKAHRASFNKRWLKEGWPGFPRDFDWTYFNAAPRDQQLPGYLVGDELLRLENLHARHASLEAFLPGVRVRWFVHEKTSNDDALREVPLVADTLVVEPDRDRLLLLWRGVTKIATKSMKEVITHYVVREDLAEPRQSLEHYRELLPQRVAAAAAAARPAEVPPMAPLPPVEIPDEPMDWDQWEKDLLAEKERLDAQARELFPPGESPIDRAKAILVKEGLDPTLLDVPASMDPKALAAELAAHREELAKIDPNLAVLFGPVPSADELDPEKIARSIEEEIEKPFPGEVPEAGEAKPEEARRPEWTRESVIAHARDKGSFDAEVLRGLDLSGLDFEERSFRGAVLADCKLTGAKLDRARLDRANLAGADLGSASLVDACLVHADLTKASLCGAILHRTDLGHADCSGATLVAAKVEALRASHALFVGSALAGTSLRGCELIYADFTRADLSGCDFAESTLDDASLYSAKAALANFERASMARFRAGEGADLSHANFNMARAPAAVFEEARLDGASFRDAQLDRASFAGCSLNGANFTRASLVQARFPEAVLSNAVLIRANAFRVRFEDADLTRADFGGASCFEAEFLDSKHDGAIFDLANLKGTKLG